MTIDPKRFADSVPANCVERLCIDFFKAQGWSSLHSVHHLSLTMSFYAGASAVIAYYGEAAGSNPQLVGEHRWTESRVAMSWSEFLLEVMDPACPSIQVRTCRDSFFGAADCVGRLFRLTADLRGRELAAKAMAALHLSISLELHRYANEEEGPSHALRN